MALGERGSVCIDLSGDKQFSNHFTHHTERINDGISRCTDTWLNHFHSSPNAPFDKHWVFREKVLLFRPSPFHFW
jgi:hypothetical protein